MQESIDILYNNCYGGFSLSDYALSEYYNRENNIDTDMNDSLIQRHDPILVNIYQEIGDKINGSHSKIEIKKIPKKYKKYYVINEYDGLESVGIDYNLYKLDKIKEIVNNNTDSTIKVEEIKNILKIN